MTAQDTFLHKLTLELNYKTKEELINTMSYKELQEWMEFYSENPFMVDRNELQMATLIDILLKVNGNSDTSGLDFMISVTDEVRAREKLKQQQKKVILALESFGQDK